MTGGGEAARPGAARVSDGGGGRFPGDDAPSPLARAVADLVRGARMKPLWGRLGWHDVRRRYRRTVLGPWWITMSTGLMIALLGLVYGGLLRSSVSRYLPYVAVGVVVWGLLGAVVKEGCQVFTGARGIVLERSLPLSLHVYRMVWRNVLVFGHNVVLLPVVAAAWGAWPGWTALWAVPGLVAVGVNGVWVGLVCGTVAARFRDVPPMVDSVMRVAFLGTPIIWTPELLPGRAWLVQFNPFHHLLEVVRAPLLGEVPSAASWLAVGGITLAGWAVALALYAHCRGRIAYWV